MQEQSKYNLHRTCKACQNVDTFPLSKIEAAFELYDFNAIWRTACSKCQSDLCESLDNPHPKLDKQLLDLWGNDLALNLMEQDEELLLAKVDYLPMILEAIDDSNYLKRKTEILIEAVCILLYDNTISPEEYLDEENQSRQKIAQRIRSELILRKPIIEKAAGVIMDYVKEIVFPQIGIEYSPG